MKRFFWLPLFGLSACMIQDATVSLSENLWDSNVVSAKDGVYVSLPYAEMLVRINLDADSEITYFMRIQPQ